MPYAKNTHVPAARPKVSPERQRCPVCDFPRATEADKDVLRAKHDLNRCPGSTCTFDEEHFGQKLCWNDFWGRHRGDAIDWHAKALEADGRAACFEAAANDYKVRVEALEGALEELVDIVTGHLEDGDKLDSISLQTARAALSTTPQKRVKSLDEAAAWLNDGDEEPGGTFAYAPPRPDATEALRVAMEALLEDVRRRIEVMGNGEQSDSVRVHNRLLHQSEDALAVIHAALSRAHTTPPLRENIAAQVETLLSTPLASPDFLEGVRRAVARIRLGATTTAVDEVKRD